MTTPKDKLPAHPKTTAAVTNLPAPWPTQQKVKDLAAELDRLYPLLEAVVKVERETIGSQRLYPQADHRGAERVQESLERMEATGSRTCKKNGTNVTQIAGGQTRRKQSPCL